MDHDKWKDKNPWTITRPESTGVATEAGGFEEGDEITFENTSSKPPKVYIDTITCNTSANHPTTHTGANYKDVLCTVVSGNKNKVKSATFQILSTQDGAGKEILVCSSVGGLGFTDASWTAIEGGGGGSGGKPPKPGDPPKPRPKKP